LGIKTFPAQFAFFTKRNNMATRDILYSLPQKVSPSAIEGLETIFHFDIECDEGGQYTVQVKDGQVLVNDGFLGEPKCVVRTSDKNFIGLIKGDINPMMAVLTGKVKITNQGEMLKYAKIFGLM
jgi:putative sterol carrier protein